jgi:hypothetical protein
MTRRDDDNSNDDPRDAHLLAALRHAPDRDALPPHEVSERILAAARAAAQSTRAAAQSQPAAARPVLGGPAPWWQRLSAWLMRPQVAASFGTLVVASLVGVMWSTRDPLVAEFAPNAPFAQRADQRSVAPASAVAPPAEAAKADAGAAAAAPAGGSAADLREAKDKLAVQPPPKAVGKDAAVRVEARARSKAEAPAARAAVPTAESAATTPPAAPPPAAAPAAQAADVAAPAVAAERRSSANERDLPLLARQQGAAAARSASAAGLSLAAKARAAEPLAAIDAALAAGARWQAAGSAGGVAHGPAQRALWASVQEATRGHWEAVPPALPSDPWLVLDHGSPPRAILWIMNGALYVTAEGQSWRAPITAAQREAWTAEVGRW